MILGPPAKVTWIFGGVVALFAAFMVVNYVEAEVFLDQTGRRAEDPGDPLIWYLPGVLGSATRSPWYSGQLLGALALSCWGAYLLLRGVVQGTPMTMRKAMLAVLGSTVVFAMVGLAIGFGLGSLAPNYYRDLYEGGHSPSFNPVAMGIGLGMTQGASGGAMVGIALVWIISWFETRRATQSTDKPVKPEA
jgi:hypothetical protein